MSIRKENKIGYGDGGGLLDKVTLLMSRMKETTSPKSEGRAFLVEGTAGAKAPEVRADSMVRTGIWDMKCFKSFLQLLWGNNLFS